MLGCLVAPLASTSEIQLAALSEMSPGFLYPPNDPCVTCPLGQVSIVQQNRFWGRTTGMTYLLGMRQTSWNGTRSIMGRL